MKLKMDLHTALDIYVLEVQVPEPVMSGQTGDISDLCEFEWFQWVMLFQPKETYPDDKMFIDRCLGPVIDVGTAMTYNCRANPSANKHLIVWVSFFRLE